MRISSISNYCIKKQQSFGNLNLKEEYGRTIDGAGNRSYTDIEKGLMRIEERQMKNEKVQEQIIKQNNYILDALDNLAKVHEYHISMDLGNEFESLGKIEEICKKGQI